MKARLFAILLVLLPLCTAPSWAQTISNGQVVSVPVTQTIVNIALDQYGHPIVLTGSPTPAELQGNFAALSRPIYDPMTNSPFAGNMIPASMLAIGGTFTSLGGVASVATSATIDGAGSAWKIGSALTIGPAATLTLSNGGAVSVGTLSGSVTNQGAVSIQRGTSLSVSQNVFFTGGPSPASIWAPYTQTSGSTKVDGVLNSSVNIVGGTFGGSGVVNGSVINHATLAPGDPQTLTINGDYYQDVTGQLIIDIAGANDFDILSVNGNVSLTGDVLFNFINGYVPTADTTFSFLQTTGRVTGNFAALDVTGLTCPTCTFDLSTLSLDIGPTAPASPTPEPGTWALLVLGSIAFATFRKRR